MQNPNGSLKSKREQRQFATKWLINTEHRCFTQISASRQCPIGCKFFKGFSLKPTTNGAYRNLCQARNPMGRQRLANISPTRLNTPFSN
ncbi:hypothetical protein GCWU000324_00958 [Kingella oralis ATCC 51147]|uniref:Uncharacterized protein n=1 Tax=Kingella oralis ATCC 51147 TaxID=629741 RepID=C4GFP2_9NEIS|nr:hypothetical protein GCWU000324_00958 [Kingella oralis ATCC 51147]